MGMVGLWGFGVGLSVTKRMHCYGTSSGRFLQNQPQFATTRQVIVFLTRLFCGIFHEICGILLHYKAK